jgi:hypothetical protein
LELLEQMSERFGVRVHAYVLMDNHYHLLVETPGANLSRAMQWLGVSYTVWFNRRHQRAGHLFQGRFKAIVLDRDECALELSRYVHLNPVRVRRLGLDKAGQQRSRAGLGVGAEPQLVAERLARLRRYRWSSYRAYIGAGRTPPWLECETVLLLQGGGRGERRERYRRYTEETVREGLCESPWQRLEAGVALGSGRFVQRIGKQLCGDRREQPGLRRLQGAPPLEKVIAVVERVRGERWSSFRDRYGDWGRDLVLYLGRKRSGMKLRELGQAAGGIDYVSVSMAVKRFAGRVEKDRNLRGLLAQATAHLNNVK